jgi:hypothetical protein
MSVKKSKRSKRCTHTAVYTSGRSTVCVHTAVCVHRCRSKFRSTAVDSGYYYNYLLVLNLVLQSSRDHVSTFHPSWGCKRPVCCSTLRVSQSSAAPVCRAGKQSIVGLRCIASCGNHGTPCDAAAGGRAGGGGAGGRPAGARAARRARLATGDTTLSFYAVVDCRCRPFLWDLHSNLAVLAAIFCQNDSVAPG